MIRVATIARLAFAVFAFAGVLLGVPAGPAAEEAAVDLRDWNPSALPLRQLDEGWVLYWGELVEPAALAAPAALPGGRPTRIPAAWDMRRLDGSGRAGLGVATYHLRLLLPAVAPPLALRLPVTHSASALWANGVPLIVNGAPAEDLAGEERMVRDRIALLPPPGRDDGVLDLVLHVSNHVMFTGGPTRPLSIGTPDVLYRQRGGEVAFDLFVLGGCVAAGLFFLVLYATRPREQGFAWFGGLCLSISLSYAHLNDVPAMLVPTLFAMVPNPYLIVLFLVSPAGAGLFLLLLSSLYPAEIRRGPAVAGGTAVMLYPGIVLTARLLDLDTVLLHFELFRGIGQGLVLACFLYGVAGVALAALRRRRGAVVGLTAVLVLTGAVLHDVSMVRAGTPTTVVQGSALLLFVLAYAGILGGRLNAAFAATEAVSRDLHRLTLTLEQKVAERTASLEAAARRAEDADRAKSRFLAAANHDLRQPLYAMALTIGVLDNRVRDPDLRGEVEALKSCLAGTERLLGGVLDIARLDAGAVRPRLASCDVAGLVRQTLAELGPFAAERGVTLGMANTGQFVLADSTMLSRVLANLVGNAIKHAPGGRVLVGCRRRTGRLRLEVWDEGVGIPEAEQELIFAEFVQGRAAPGQEREGLGLGLSITRRFARLMGSEVSLCSEPGRGSCFALELPLAPAPAARQVLHEPGFASGGSGLEDARVMVIDDDPMVLRAIVPLLDDWGCRAMTATDAAAARAMLQDGGEAPPDVLIVDSHLGPDDHGHRVIAELRQIVGGDLPAAIVTGDTTPERLRALAGLGFPVLHKPIQPARLASLIRHLLRARRRGDRAREAAEEGAA